MDVHVAAKNMRGAWADCSHLKNPYKVDVTSAQAKASPFRVAFSPMHMGLPYVCPDEGTFPNFEAYWQSLKVLDTHAHPGEDKKHKDFWKTIKKATRRHPALRAKHAARVLGAKHKRFPGELMGYVESRKKVYVPDYYNMIKDKDESEKLRIIGDASRTPIVVYDFDGPRDAKGNPVCEKVTVDMLRERINDESKPFGHGFVVAAMIAGIGPEQYTL